MPKIKKISPLKIDIKTIIEVQPGTETTDITFKKRKIAPIKKDSAEKKKPSKIIKFNGIRLKPKTILNTNLTILFIV